MQINVVGRPDAQVRMRKRQALVGNRQRPTKTIPNRQETAQTDIIWISIGVVVIFVVSMMA